MIKKYQLKNGMTVILQESHKSPVVSAQVWVRTGSADEGRGEEGISHFIEHLVFKGTRKFGVGEIASTIEGSGGELNAYTSFDQTVFYISISKHFADVGLECLSEMMGFPKFDPVEIDNERGVVIEEIKRGNDSFGRRASQQMFSTTYHKHAYGIPVIGYEKNVLKWSAKKIVDYYHSRYSPQNMFLVVVGDFSSPEMKKKVQKYFGEFKAYKMHKSKRTKEPKITKPRFSVEKAAFEQNSMYMAWPTPAINHKDIPALDLLGMILGQGDSSRLTERLRLQEALVNGISSSVFSSKDPGLFVVSMSYQIENLEKALNAFNEVIAKVISQGFEQSELTKSMVNMQSSNLYSMETVEGLARKIGDAEFSMHDPKSFEQYLKDLAKVTLKDLDRVFKKYIQAKSMVVTAMTKDDAKKCEKILKAWHKSFDLLLKKTKISKSKKSVSKKTTIRFALKKHKAVDNKTKVVKLKNGIRLLLRPSFETQVISVRASSLGGMRFEPEHLEGMTELCSRTWTAATKTRNEAQINEEMELLGAGIGPIAGRNTMGLNLDVLAPFEQKASELYMDLLVHPQFPQEIIEREKQLQLQQIKHRNDNPAQVCMRQMSAEIFKDHPYSRDPMGSNESLIKIGNAEITKFWQQQMNCQNITAMVAGAVDVDLWVDAFEKAGQVLGKGQKWNKQFAPHYPQQNIYKFTESQKEQCHLAIAYPGLTLENDERFALHLIESILSGQGGRLFIELRDKNSLAYSVSPLRMEGLDAGYFGAYIGCTPDKAPKALEMMRVEFSKLCDKKIGEEELLRSQKYLTGRHDLDLQRVSSLAASILYDDIYGIPFDQTFHLAEKYFSVTAEEIQTVARKIFSGKSVISLVGPVDNIKHNK